ncbi:MAG TPA: mechanosensitive ion channel domain-containing protein [Candidatus Polarisedimenticolaceae bacterium]|nr:mechanosensitive ion channel domain-containing protein [Candidatus Polarisedimenticolaceae bacterium]
MRACATWSRAAHPAAILLAVLAGLSAEAADPLSLLKPDRPASAEPAPPPEHAPPAPREITPLPGSEVPRAAISARTRIRAIRSLAARTAEMDAIHASEKSVLASVEALKEWMRTRELRQQPSRALRSVAQEWRLDEEMLAQWMQSTGHRLDALSDGRAELGALSKRWTLTAARLQADAAPAEIQEQAASVLLAVEEAEIQVSQRIDAVLLVQSRISAARLDAEEALDKIATSLHDERRGLLTIDSPPLWNIFGVDNRWGGFGEELRAAFVEGRRALSQYAVRSSRNVGFQILLFAVLAIVFARLRPASRGWLSDEKGLKACAHLVHRPLLGAFLVALLCSPWIHPRAPLVFYELASLLLVIPVVLLLWKIVRREARRPLIAVAVLFSVERLWELTLSGSILERLVLLGLTALAGGGLVWTLRSGNLYRDPEALPWWRAVTTASRFAMAALLVSLVANVTGNASLARLLTMTVVRAAYGALVLYAATLLVQGGATLLVRSAAKRGFRAVARHQERILHRTFVAIHATAVFFFALLVLVAADLVPLVRELASETLTRPWSIGQSTFSIASILIFVGAVYLAVVASRIIRAVLEEDVYPRLSLPRGLPNTLTMMARYGVLTIGFLIALSIAGIPLDRLAIVLGALSVGIGFGLQTVVNNFVSGLILMFERPIQIGDAVEVGGLVGRVRKIGVRASTVETFDGADVVVPNATLVSNQLVNWTLSSRSRRIEVQVGVAFGSDLQKVLPLLREAVRELPGVLAEPPPLAIVRALGASSIDLSVLFWTADFEGWTAVRSVATVRVYQALRESGIEIPFPQQEVRVVR